MGHIFKIGGGRVSIPGLVCVVLAGQPLSRRRQTMRYMLLICGDENAEMQPGEDMTDATLAWVEEMNGRNVRVHGYRLRPTTEAAIVQVRAGELVVSDGPFAETKEQMGGYDVIECVDLDEAIEIASKHPVAKVGTVEVRPFYDDWEFNKVAVNRFPIPDSL